MLTRNKIRLIPAADKNPTIVRLAQTLGGRAVIVGIYSSLLLLHGDPYKWFATLALLPLIFFPNQRRKLIAVIALLLLLVQPYGFLLARPVFVGDTNLGRALHVAVALAAFALCAVYVHVASTRETVFLAKWPVATLLCLFGASIVAASLLPQGSGLAHFIVWGLIAAVGAKIWCLCYSLKSRTPRRPGDLFVEVGHYNAFWWGSFELPGAPMPKAGTFLDRIDSKTPEELAVWQIKGLKLVLWAVLLGGFRDLMLAIAHGKPLFGAQLFGAFGLGIPTFDDALLMTAAGAPLPFYMNWLSLGIHFFANRLLQLAIVFHIAIGTCRVAGFKALRGMYRPLDARSLADFWNRVHFYFKELMVEFFFFPVFVRYLRRHPRLRLFIATFAAACFGNFIFHLLRDIDAFSTMGLVTTLKAYRRYALYTFLLALGIALSQLWERRKQAPGAPPSKEKGSIATTAAVLLCYCLLGVLDDGRGFSIRDSARFYLNLLPSNSSAELIASP